MRRLVILGSTGSIGRQALEVVEAHRDRFRVAGLAGGSNVALLAAQARRYCPEAVACADEREWPRLRAELAGLAVKVIGGRDAAAELAATCPAEQVLVAIVGAAGIAPTLAAIAAGKDVALANKETLVAAGALVTSRARAAGVKLIPVDSEHSAVFQCLVGVGREALRHIILTASGGPFRTWPLERMARVTAAQALQHPNWSMGAKITIDSATLVNKGLEVIEAHWLFALDFERIKVIIHPESAVHSLVELVDGAMLAQMGTPDMRLPIAYALSYPERLPAAWPGLNGLAGATWHFEEPDRQRFPALALAYEMGKRGGTWPAVMSAANEVAVEGFLHGGLGFLDIVRIVEQVCGHHGGGTGSDADLGAILAADAWARAKAAEIACLTRG